MASTEIKVQGLTLYVTDEHVNHRGEFIFHCKELNMSEITLKEATCVEEATKGAVSFIKGYLLGKITALEALELKVLEETK
jgi:hypothetical protein